MDRATRFSARASLMVIGLRMRALGIWKAVEEHVDIEQKVMKYRPIDKVLDAFIMMLAGGRGLVEVNTRVRPDSLLQQAFGRDGCAEQSTVSETFNACTPENVVQMRQALHRIYQQHSRACDHDYDQTWQVLDVDLSGLPAGSQGEGVTKGYFSGAKKRRGRQLGRVVATLYDEIVAERLYAGRTQLHHSLLDLIRASEEVLTLLRPQRERTLLRVDSGGGEDAQINAMLRRGYGVLVKAHSWKRAVKLARQVKVWLNDPKDPGRQVARVPQPVAYAKPTRQVLVRVRKQNGRWSYSMLVCAAPDSLLAQLGHIPIRRTAREIDQLLAIVYAYDRRGGAAETQFKGDKQGLLLSKRNKHAFAAQEMLVLLAQLAHNLLIWTRRTFSDSWPTVQGWGILRLIRDVMTIPGKVELDDQGHLRQIALNRDHPLAGPFVQAYAPLLTIDTITLRLDQL
jgi:DDE family transposase